MIQEERDNNHSLPFIALTETWLKSYISDAQLHITGYAVSRSDRAKRLGGGVLLYSHLNIPVTETARFDDGICEVLLCRFDTIKTCIAVVYRPPDAECNSFNNALNFLSSELNKLTNDFRIQITGDFNSPVINWETFSSSNGSTTDSCKHCSTRLLSFISDNLMNQYVRCPTRKENILDLFITNDDKSVQQISCADTDMSDHKMVDILLSDNPLCTNNWRAPTFDEHSFRALDFSKADFDAIGSKLKSIDWVPLRSICTFEEFPILFTDTVFQICSSMVPRRKTPTGRPRVLQGLRRRKVRLKARLNALLSHPSPNPEHVNNIKGKLALLYYETKEAINKHKDFKEQAALQKIKNNSKYFFSYAKSLSTVKSNIPLLIKEDGKIVTDPEGMANLLQSQFSSVYSDPNSSDKVDPTFIPPSVQHPTELSEFDMTDEEIIAALKTIPKDAACGPDGIPAILLNECAAEFCEPFKIIWSESFALRTVPQFYKDTFINPIYKKGSKAHAANYRPVALTSHIVKTFERLLRDIMVRFIERNGILADNQHGFRPGRSCLTQLLGHFDDVIQGLANNKDTDAIYLDYAKAFDKVDHDLLLKKLRRYGFHEQLIAWIESFLTGRSQRVVVDGVSSFAGLAISGVPQGSVLGPILFILFVNDMKDCVKYSIIRLFADDTRILKGIDTCENVQELQEDLLAVINWARVNNMHLHEEKFQYIAHRFTKSSTLEILPFTTENFTYSLSDGTMLYPTHEVKDLGVNVTSDLSWAIHIATAAAKGRSMASWVFSAFLTRERSCMMILYKSLVRSHLEYCCVLWDPRNIGLIQQLEAVQRTFTSKIWGVSHLNYWDRLKALGLMSLQRRRERYALLHMWKILNNKCPNDAHISFLPISRSGILAKVPSLVRNSSCHNQSIYDQSFAVVGPTLWNSIPGHLHGIGEQQRFKIQLTKFLTTIPDKPPVSGYCRSNDNSILDWAKNKNAAALRGRSDNVMSM